ncbi:MAG: sigma-70 family RNA polymerase sigma factor [Blastocatellia bacterium]|nr:sigma-70 family RNA polymerase sigma factor [Blastocatellia bacterium]
MARSILERIALGEKQAVQDCLDTYGNLIWALARKLSPNPADAEDAVQEIFIDLWKHAARFDAQQASETTFVAMIARRRLIDRIRKVRRNPEADPLPENLAEPPHRHDQQLEIKADAARAAHAMHVLRPEQQQVLKLAIFQGFSHQEIAESTGLSLGTVKTHIRRGLVKIREVLGVRSLDSAAKETTSL